MSDSQKYPDDESRGTLSGVVIGATILTAALIGASALVVVVTTSPLAANTAAVSSSSPQPTDAPDSSISPTGSLAPASVPNSESSAPAVSNASAGQDVKPASQSSSQSSSTVVSPQKALSPWSPSKTSKWASAKSGTLMSQITDDSGLVLQDYSVRDYVSTLRECSVLAAEVKSAQAQPAIPDPAMQKRYASALTEFAAGARSCSAAITQHSDGPENVTTTVNRSVMTQALSDFRTGSRDLYAAAERLRRR